MSITSLFEAALAKALTSIVETQDAVTAGHWAEVANRLAQASVIVEQPSECHQRRPPSVESVGQAFESDPNAGPLKR